jgi:hypothetical protein
LEVKLANFAKSKNLRVKSTLLPHRNFYKYTWTSPVGKTHNQIDHLLVDKRRRHSNVFDVRSLRAADCDTENYLVVAKVSSAETKITQITYEEVQSQEVKRCRR